MNLLFEISDTLLIVVGIIIVLIIAIIAIIIKVSTRKIKPIEEEERYDNDEGIEITKITKEEMTDEQKAAKAELERVFNQMSADLEKQKEATDEIEEFEKEQEENAIISYQELMEQAEKLKREADKYEKLAESKADMKVKSAMNTFEKHEVKKEKQKTETIKPEKHKGFKNSEIISPIYGIQSNKNMVRQKNSSKNKKSGIISKAYEQEKFEEEKTQNLDFLNSLKEFRKNL